jgi:hypothetical protein
MVAIKSLGHLDRARYKAQRSCAENLMSGNGTTQNVKISFAFGIVGALGAGCSARLMIGGGGSTA